MPTRTKLTKRSVDAIPEPKTGVADVWDTEIPAFHVRIWPSGKRSYRLKYRAGGRQRIITIGPHGAWTAEQARARALAYWQLVSDGRDPLEERDALAKAEAAERAAAITVGELIERWLVEGRLAAPDKRERSWAVDASRLRRHIVPLLGERPARELTRKDIERAQHQIANGKTAADIKTGKFGRAIITGGPTVARGAVVSLSSCLSWAEREGLIAANVAKGVKKAKPVKRERFLSGAEAARLLAAIAEMEAERAIPNQAGDVIRLLMLTGARKSEILNLAWSEVDVERGLIVLPRERSKTGEKVMPLSRAALALIAARQGNDSPFVFPSARDRNKPFVGLQKVWDRIRTRAGMEDVRIHDLRHSFASFAVLDGANLPLIAKALGHSQTSTTERYAHLGQNPVRDLAERVGEVIMANTGTD